MDIRKLRKVIELVKTTGIAEIEIREGEDVVRVKATPDVQQAPSQPSVTHAPIAAPAQAPVQAPTAFQTEEKTETEQVVDGHPIKSPMVGTFYRSPSPDASPFIEIGQQVSAGDTVCIIEAMKMFNEIEADKSGVVKAILVPDGTPVEFGETLVVIE